MKKLIILCLMYSCTKEVSQDSRINALNYTSIELAQEAAHTQHKTLFFPTGKYGELTLLYDTLQIEGEDSTIFIYINCNQKKFIRLSHLTVDARGTGKDGIESSTVLGDKPLYQIFENLTIIGDGTQSYKHGLICQGGGNIDISNITVKAFYHGIAIRSSNVRVKNITAIQCGFTSVIVKSDRDENKLTENVSIDGVNIIGDPSNPWNRGGAVMVDSYSDESVTRNITISNVISKWGGVATILIAQDFGHVSNVQVSNSSGESCGDNSDRATFDIQGGDNISFTNCTAISSVGTGYRSTSNTCVVKQCYEQGSKTPYSGTFQFLQLNELIK